MKKQTRAPKKISVSRFPPYLASVSLFRARIREALSEDIGSGDVTSMVTISPSSRIHGVFLAKSDGTVAGLAVAEEAFRQTNRNIVFTYHVHDGERITRGTKLASVSGPGRAVLSTERVALNFLQRMSGIATKTREFVDAVRGTQAIILDTRKTVPLLRPFDKWAVVLGGGINHRFGLYDAVLIKDNHIAAAGGIQKALIRIKSRLKKRIPVIVEVTTTDELKIVLAAKQLPDRVLLDNMDLKTMKTCVAIAGNRVPLEASGGVTLKTVRAIAKTGVHYISVGALTHSVQAMDISLEIAFQKK